MRLLQIRFQNLNSLAGEWEIDLTHQAYTSDGIFAITGPTGAGKTTILDAICLALYGRTPRLSRVTKSENDIMSRHTGECFAEVTFETQSGVFRCHWSQRRARKKPDGELQSPKHEIADVSTSQIMETKLRGVASQIELVTGMDFDRFTRSMLLAQGGFAAFLQAGADERAPILEQITGTAIYSQISICVHERRAQERKQLDCLQAEMAGMRLLTKDEVQLYNQQLDNALPQEIILNQHVSQTNLALNWLDTVERLSKEKRAFDEAKQKLHYRQITFAPQREKLSRAKQSLELAGEYAALLSTRQELVLARQSQSECQAMLPEHNTIVGRAEDALQHANTCLMQAKVAQKEALPIIRYVRELDIKLQEKQLAIDAAKKQFVALEVKHRALQTKNMTDQRLLDTKKLALVEVDRYLAENKSSARLIEHLSGIQSRFTVLRERDDKQREKSSELAALEEQIIQMSRVRCEKLAFFQSSKHELNAIEKIRTQQQHQLEQTRENRTVNDWRNALVEIKEKQNSLSAANALAQAISESTHKLNDLSHQHSQLLTVKQQLEESIGTHTEQHTILIHEIQVLENQLSIFNHFMTFNDARLQLQENVPCPLCGAKEHPFAEGTIPVTTNEAAALQTLRKNLNQLDTTISDLKIQHGSVKKDLEMNLNQQKEKSAKIAADRITLNVQRSFLSVFEHDATTSLQALITEHERITSIVLVLEAHEKEIEYLRVSIEKEQARVIQSERAYTQALHDHDIIEQALSRVKKELHYLQSLYQNAYDDGLAEVVYYGVERLSLNTLDSLLSELTLRRDQWLIQQQQKSELGLYVSTLELQLKHQIEQITLHDQALQQQKHDLDIHLSQQLAWLDKRQHLFLNKNPEDEELRLSTAIESADNDVTTARNALNEATQNRAMLISQLDAHEKAIHIRDHQLNKLEPLFKSQLMTMGFCEEASYIAACLPEEVRNNLIQQERQLETELTELDARLADKSTQLDVEIQKNITLLSRETLNLNLTTQIQQLRNLQQEISGVQQRLHDNELVRQKQTVAANALDAQKRECLRWDKLHELIGSSDGKKYRNFAQGLTFEMMIGYANKQLQKMTDRYLLIRDNSQPLDLNVMDNYQAGEIRSTKNLSGGESFIVSMALALGLSNMSSKNVRVDSLFLDEGFGTLDEEALDIALDTLSGLQQDGKLIGVISHVSTLKERISTQIRVVRSMRGRSSISGPGCRHMQ